MSEVSRACAQSFFSVSLCYLCPHLVLKLWGIYSLKNPPLSLQLWFSSEAQAHESESLFNFRGGSDSKVSACNQKTRVWSLGQKDHLKKGMATHSNILAWEILWIEKPGGLQVTKRQTQLSDYPTPTYPVGISPWTPQNKTTGWTSLASQKIVSLSVIQKQMDGIKYVLEVELIGWSNRCDIIELPYLLSCQSPKLFLFP